MSCFSQLLSLEARSVKGAARPMPLALQQIVTPLKHSKWAKLLSGHPDMAFRDYILRDIQQGFRIGFDRSSKLGSRPLNLPSEEKNGGGGDGYIEEERAQGRLLELTASQAESQWACTVAHLG